MSQGKYSPICPHSNDSTAFVFNCYGKTPTLWNKEVADAGVQYDEKTMFDDYDSEGFDRYGYSCFDNDGNYVGLGCGVDRLGRTENEYMVMDPDDFWSITDNA